MTQTPESIENAIAVVGMDGRFPGFPSVDALWEGLLAGDEGITLLSPEEIDPAVPAKLRTHARYVRARGMLDDIDAFDAGFFGISPVEASMIDPQQRFLLECAWHALEDAGIVVGASDAPIGVWVGANWNTYFSSRVLASGSALDRYGEFNARIANERDFIASRISYKLNLKGPSITVSTACSTSLVAIAEAVQALRNFECDAALAGGVSITVPNRVGYLYQEGGMLSKDGHCRPFDASSSGTTFNDGLAMVVLKRVEDALEDNDRIYALIRGTGVNNDGSDKVSYSAPSVRGQREALELALADADIDPSTVGFIEAHGTATPLGDPIEVEAIRGAYVDDPDGPKCLIGSIKSNIGHGVHAAGAAGLIKACLAVRSGTIPRTLFFSRANPRLELDRSRFSINAETASWPQGGIRRAGVSSFGVGGTNAHVIVEQLVDGAEEEVREARGPYVLAFSGKTRSAARAAKSRLARQLEDDATLHLRDAAYTLACRRTAFEHRIACVARNIKDASAALNASPGPTVIAGQAREFQRLVFAFPGQGAQFPGMAAAAYAESAVFREAFERCMAVAEPLLDDGFRALLVDLEQADGAAQRLAETRLAQPALFAVGYGLARHVLELGIEPDALVGHSIGEYVAACIAGVFSPEDAMRMVVERGRLMQSQPPGAMLAVASDVEGIRSFLSDEVELGAINAPDSCVLSGPTAEIERVAQAIGELGLKTTPLKTSHAFHSAMMEGTLPKYREVVALAKLSPARLPIASTKTGTWLTDEEATSASYWAEQIRQPVRFAAALDTLLEVPCCVVELGPGSSLTALGTMRRDERHAFVGSIGAARQPAPMPLARTLGELWVRGAEIPWREAFDFDGAKLADLPKYPFERESHWLEVNESAQDESAIAPNTAPAAAVSVRSRLNALIGETTGIDLNAATPDQSFAELGLDSLSLTQVAIAIQDTFEVDVTFRQLGAALSSPSALVAYLEEHGKPPVEPSQAAPDAWMDVSPTGDPVAAMLAQLKRMEAQLAELGTRRQGPRTSGVPVKTDIRKTTRNKVREARASDDRPHSVQSWDDLDAERAERLKAFIAEHAAKTAGSKEHTQRYRRAHADPRTASGFNRVWKEIVYPLVCNRSEGAHIYDVDGNRYIDLLSGFGPNLLGHGRPEVAAAVARQLQEGIEIGPQSHLAGEAAELVCELTGMDRASFVCTGSEAVAAAMRCVRTFTRRDRIVLFRGDYHGNFDEVLVRGLNGDGYLRSQPSAPGIPKSSVNDIIELEYGNPNSLEILREIQDTVAGVMVEPVQSRRPELQPREFLHSLRAICDESGAQLIFDEVVTGFRCHPGGAQAVFGVRADIATYGKAVAGNLPIGIVAGRAALMDTFDGGYWSYGDDSSPEAPVTFFAGTFVRHPLAIAACHAMLEVLQEEGPSLQETLAERAAAFSGEMNRIFQERDLPFELPHFTSVMYLRNRDWSDLGSLLWYQLRHHGVFMLEGFPSYVTFAHTENVLDEAKQAFVASLDAMQEAGLLPKSRRLNPDIGERVVDPKRPPVPGARLGRDRRGRPAWFVPDSNNPKKFIQIEGPT